MKPHEVKFSTLIIFMIALGTLVIILILVINGIPKDQAISIFTRFGIVSGSISLFWVYLNNVGWAHYPFRLFGWLVDRPDLRGRWEGQLDREGENNPHAFVLEINQTLTRIQCHAFSENNKSSSITADIISDLSNKNFQLALLWLGTGSKRDNIDSGLFHGFTILDFKDSKKEKKLDGFYFTNRSPNQTKGIVKVKWISKETKNSFA